MSTIERPSPILIGAGERGLEIDQVDVTPDGEKVLGYCAAGWQKKGMEEACPIQV